MTRTTESRRAARLGRKTQEPSPPQRSVATGTVANSSTPKRTSSGLANDAAQYQVDFWQRSVLFVDTLRERASNMLAHEAAGLPPLLGFEYETVIDARTFERPANYALLRISAVGDACLEDCVHEAARPVIVVDPRAGHGPGIGGFKQDSEVGIAMHEGHPVYFVVFFPQPCPGQTLADVLHALRRFVEEVSRRHGGQAPVLYGNCQAGWAITLLAADCTGLAGPAVLNGSPLSYWAGSSDVNPMRITGGLVGGTWLSHFLSDFGNGKFDGAWLVQNFESLNPANSLWGKYYDLFANVDAERERFLDFERWWSGFYFLSREEIVAIVENLFVGNKLEQGEMRICDRCVADLRRIRNPLVIFASSGDNITPPHQALNWIPAVYPTTQSLEDAGQRIVYLLNQHVGHLGIFVSASVARLEHRAILESVEALEGLKPGLYEMKIDNPTGDPDCRRPQYSVSFERRRVEDIRFDYPRDQFERARDVSELNELLYATFLSPWVKMAAAPWSADLAKWLHPMRVSRYTFSERVNPWMIGLSTWAQWVRQQRRPARPDNPFVAAEREVARQVSAALDRQRQLGDAMREHLFRLLYGNG